MEQFTLSFKIILGFVGSILTLLGAVYSARIKVSIEKEKIGYAKEAEEKEAFQKKIDKIWEKIDLTNGKIDSLKSCFDELRGEHKTLICQKNKPIIRRGN